MAYGLWPMAHGLWPMAYGLWPIDPTRNSFPGTTKRGGRFAPAAPRASAKAQGRLRDGRTPRFGDPKGGCGDGAAGRGRSVAPPMHSSRHGLPPCPSHPRLRRPRDPRLSRRCLHACEAAPPRDPGRGGHRRAAIPAIGPRSPTTLSRLEVPLRGRAAARRASDRGGRPRATSGCPPSHRAEVRF